MTPMTRGTGAAADADQTRQAAGLGDPLLAGARPSAMAQPRARPQRRPLRRASAPTAGAAERTSVGRVRQTPGLYRPAQHSVDHEAQGFTLG